MTKVVHVLPKYSSASWSGAEASVEALIPRLERRGFHGEVWTSTAFATRRIETLNGVRIHRFSGVYPPRRGVGWSTRSQAGIGAAPLCPGLIRQLARVKPDLVHLHCHNKLSSSVALACRALRIPYLITLHSKYVPGPMPDRPWAADTCLAHAGSIQTTSGDCLVPLERRHPDQRLTYCALGVDPERFRDTSGQQAARSALGLPAGAKMAIHLGRVCRLKNQSWSVELLTALRATDPSWHLTIVGPVSEQDYADEVRGEITRRGLGPHITWLPPFPPGDRRLPEVMAAADLLLLPSRHEAQGLVVLEAWASGMGAVVNRVTAVPQPAGAVLGVDLHDPPERIAGEIAPYMRGAINQDLLHNLTSQYSWDVTADLMAGEYAAVLAPGPATRTGGGHARRVAG